jgi:hypothetical protein
MILKEFEKFSPFLLGKNEEEKHFIVEQGDLYCIRENCDNCKYSGKGCEFEETEIQTAIIPNTRRGIGFEEKDFLILILKEGLDFVKDVPKELWDNPHSDKSLYESNLHFILSNLKNKFRVLKGQFRFYGNKEEFEISEYSKYFQIFSEYTPKHYPVSMDFSAIEPRLSTIVSREPHWVKIFVGEPKVIIKEINAENINELDSHFIWKGDRLFCFLDGELDKADYDNQCKKCVIQDKCNVVNEYQKNVPGDWHSLNAIGLFEEFEGCKDKYAKKEMRGKSKVIGLALTYDGSAFTVSKVLGEIPEKAQERIDNFFKLLNVERRYMIQTKRSVLKTGITKNLFGRVNNISNKAFSSSFKERGYAQRVALNYPIQGTGAELLKISKIRVDEFITNHKLNPYYGQSIKEHLNREELDYRLILCSIANTIHDEVMYLMYEDKMEDLIAELYTIMQTRDVVKAFGINFDIELDCEYDGFRSWTASKLYPNAKVFFKKSIGITKIDSDLKTKEEVENKECNTIILNIEDAKNIIRRLNTINMGELKYDLIVNIENQKFLYNDKVSLEEIKSFKIPYSLINT